MRFEDGNIYFNLIIVIQSLNERATGLELYDDILKRFTWKDPSLQAEIHNVHSREELMDLLGELENRCKSRSTFPLIHFETHGTKDGILLTSGEEVQWKEIGAALGRINSYTGNNLFISVAACYGGYIQFLVDVSKPCPFRASLDPWTKYILAKSLLHLSPSLRNY